MNANRIAQTAAAAAVVLCAVAGGMFASSAASANQEAVSSIADTVAPAAHVIAAGYAAAEEAEAGAGAADNAAVPATGEEAEAQEAQASEEEAAQPAEVAEAVAPAAQVVEEVPARAEEVVAEPAAQAPTNSVWVINVNCAGGQSAIDTCIGATNYLPAMEVLGVPYYAQHDYLGGAAWLQMKIGDTVQAEGVTYYVSDERTIVSGGSSAQIHDMYADAFLQTCTGDGVHSRVLALVRLA